MNFKLKLLEEAKSSNNREVAKKYGVDESCIRSWRKNEEQIIKSIAEGRTFKSKGHTHTDRSGLQLSRVLTKSYSTTPRVLKGIWGLVCDP